MAYKLLYNDELLFDPYSDNIVTDAQLTSKYNNPDYFDFTVPITNDLYNKLSERSGSVKLFYDNEKIFDGIITSIDIDMDGNKSVKCSGPLDYLNDTLVRPYATTSGESQTLAPNTVSGIFQWYIDQHNQHTMDPRKHFSVGVNQGAMLSENNVFSRKSDSLPTTWNEIKNAILEDHGGFIFVEYSGDSNVLNLYGDIHESNAQIIDFGVNITDFSKTTDTADQYTAIRPSGYTPEAPENDTNKKMYPITISDLPDNPFDSDLVKKGDIIYSISAVKRYGYKEYAYSNNDITDTNNLLKSAAVILKTLITPAETITVKAVDLALYMNGYKHLRVGQAVRIRSKLHSTDEYMMVNSIVLDINNPSNTEYEFGIPYDTLTGQQSSYLKNLNSSINSTIDSVAGLDRVSKDTAKKAEDAKNTANVAKDTANTAQNTANSASSKADKAQTTADTANTTANKAQTTATTAKDTADKAQATATDAKTTADSANKAAEELKKKTAEIDKQVEAASNAADAASAKADQVRTDLQKQVDANKEAADAASAKADQVRTDLTQQVQNVKSEMDSAVEAAQTSANEAQSAADAAQEAADKANASTVDLDKSIKAVDAKAIAAKQAAAEAQSKAENVASDLDSANAVIEQHSTELGELTTKVTNAVNKSDSALSVSTEAKQTATEASTTATSAYADAQTALTQSTTATQTATTAKTTAESASKTASDSLKQSSAAVQTANQISTTLRTEYQTKADADKLYATQSSLKQTSDSITASVSKTYATKDALSALQNVADNAIESWRGTGVPTLTNKPASDWTTNADKKKHSGDLYYDKSTGKAYRFGSDDGETYTWELNQDTDVTKALENAAKAQTSANNAQASATAANTAAGNAQSTANTAVSNAATAKNAADAAQSSANKAQGDVDKLKIDIPETYATKSSLTQTAESITANVESVKATANSAVTAASNAQQTADSISANLTKNYQTKSQADTIYATKASLKATSDSISAEVTKAQGTADGAVTAASNAQQTADAVTLNLSKNYQTKAQNDALYATQTSLKATSDSLSANITANAKTAQSAVDKATSLEANLNGFKTTVSQTYGRGSNLWVNPTFDADKPQITSLVDDVTAPNGSGVNLIASRDHHNDATSFPVVPGHTYVITATIKRLKGDRPLNAGIWYTAQTSGHSFDSYGGAESTSDLSDGWMSARWRITCKDGKSKGCVFFQIEQPARNPSTQWYVANVVCVDVTGLQPAGDYATKSSLTQTANSIKAEVTEVSKTANSAMTKATTVEQTANGLSSKITEQGKTLNATVTTANEAKSTADSNKTAISQTANLVDAALSGDNLITDGGFESTEWWKGLKKPFHISTGSFYHGKHVLVCDAVTGDSRCPLTHEKGKAGSATTIPVTKGRTYRLSGYCAWLSSVPSNVNPSSDKLRLAKPDGSFIAEAPCSKSTSWSETHVDWKCPDDGSITSVKIEVMHQTDGTILWDDVAFRDITEAAATSNRVSSVEQNLNGFKTTVSETYATKNDVGVENLIKNGDFSDGKTNWTTNGGTSKIVDGTYGKQFVFTQTGTNRNGSNRIYNDTHKHIIGQAYEVSFYAKADKSSKWRFGHTGSKAASATLDTTLKQYTMQYQAENTTVFSVWTDNPTATIYLERVKLSVASGYYATKTEVTQTANSIKAEVTEVSKTANGALTKATTVEQTANGLSSKITEQGKTLNATVTTANEAKSTADSNKTAISQVSTTASDALTKASTVEQNLNGFKTTVSETYTTKDDFNDLTVGGTNRIILTGVKSGRIGTDGTVAVMGMEPDHCTTIPVSAEPNTKYTISGSIGTPKNSYVSVAFYDENGKFISRPTGAYTVAEAPWKNTFTSPANAVTMRSSFPVIFKGKIKLEKGTKPTDWSPAPEDLQPAGDYATKSSLTQTANSIKAEVTEVSKTANNAMSKATTVEQTANGLSSKITEQGKTLNATVTTANEAKSTADSNKTAISQVSTTASDALTKASTVEQNLNGFKTTVSETYTTKNDFNNLTIGGRNLLLNSDFSKGTDNWVLELQNSGKGTVEAQSLSGFSFAKTMLTINVTNNTSGQCRIYQLRSPNPMQTDTVDTVSFWATASETVPVLFGRLDDQRFITVQKGWHYYNVTVPKWNGSNAFCIGFKNGFIGALKITNIMWEHASKASQWSPAPEDLQPAGDYSTKSYVDQTAKSVALGVVQNYKGADGSGLATKSDITVAKDSITSTVANTYATKSGVTQEISSTITQNNNSLDVKFATKTETQEAQNTANTANSNATNAQSRVGNIEDCITLTSNGVRAGKQSNGVFTGVSALVNTDGSFDLLDSNGKLLTRINQHTFRVTGDNGVGAGYITLSQKGINITVMPTDDPNEQYHIRIGSGGISLTSPDGASMNCSSIYGMTLETNNYGKLAIGPLGLQFTNDQGWGLRLSANGWSLKWAGNHQIATGPTDGKLYIDGHEIVTR